MENEWSEVWSDLVNAGQTLDRVQVEVLRQQNIRRAYIGGEVTKPNRKMKEWGWKLSEDHDLVVTTEIHIANLKDLEKEYTKEFKKVVEQHPLYPWIEATPAVGPLGVGRLLSSIGNPAWHPLEDRPRRLGELNRFCGMDVVNGKAPERVRGQRLHKSPLACTKLWVIAERAGKNRCETCKTSPAEIDPDLGNGTWTPPPAGCTCADDFPYRAVHDEERDRQTHAVHIHGCRGWHKCQRDAGDPLRPGHKRARAVRITAKQILKDLWLEARRIDGIPEAA